MIITILFLKLLYISTFVHTHALYIKQLIDKWDLIKHQRPHMMGPYRSLCFIINLVSSSIIHFRVYWSFLCSKSGNALDPNRRQVFWTNYDKFNDIIYKHFFGQKQASQTGINNYIPQNTVGYNYLSLWYLLLAPTSPYDGTIQISLFYNQSSKLFNNTFLCLLVILYILKQVMVWIRTDAKSSE